MFFGLEDDDSSTAEASVEHVDRNERAAVVISSSSSCSSSSSSSAAAAAAAALPSSSSSSLASSSPSSITTPKATLSLSNGPNSAVAPLSSGNDDGLPPVSPEEVQRVMAEYEDPEEAAAEREAYELFLRDRASKRPSS